MQALYVEAEIPRARVAWTYFLNKIAVKRSNIEERGENALQNRCLSVGVGSGRLWLFHSLAAAGGAGSSRPASLLGPVT